MRSSIDHVAVEAEQDLGAAVVAEAVDDLGELVADDRALALGVGEDRLEVGDLPLELGGLVDDLLALEGGEAAQLHGEDRVGLQLVDRRAASIRPSRASSTVGDRRMSAMTSSSASSALR